MPKSNKPILAGLLALFLSSLPFGFAQSADEISLPDLGEPALNSASVQPNISAQGAGFTYQDNSNGKRITLTPQYTQENGTAIGGSFAGPLAKNMAVGVLLSVGSDKNEWLLNTGFDLSSNQRFIFSVGQLRQKPDFSFSSGVQKAKIRQDNLAVNYQYYLAKHFLNAAEINAYISDTHSVNLSDKTYYTDTASLYELWTDPRRIAGGRVSGVQGRLVFTPTSKSNLKLGLGAERLEYDLLSGQDRTTRATGSAEFNHRLDHGIDFRASVNAGAAQSRYALGLGKSFKEGAQLGIDVATVQGRDNTFNDQQVMLSYTQSLGGGAGLALDSKHPTLNTRSNHLDASGAPINPPVLNTAATEADATPWTSSLVDQVSRRPSVLPAQVIAKIDTSAAPTRLIAINKTADVMPAGHSIDTATGILTVPIGTNVSAIASVTQDGAAFTNNSQFALSGTTNLVINPNLITPPATGTDTYVVTMNNSAGGGTTLATVVVSTGSTRIDSVLIGPGTVVISTAAIAGVTPPVAGATPVTTSTAGTGYTGTVSWSPAVSGTFAYNTVYTATVTLTASSGYTLSGVAANFFTVTGTSSSATHAANSGVVTAAFPATTATLPSGYITQGGLTWAPITTKANWNAAATTCSASTALGYGAGTWRQPTKDQLVALYNARPVANGGTGGIAPAVWPPTGWTLFDTWSSSGRGAGNHYYVYLHIGYVDWGIDINYRYVSCVH